MTEGSTIKCQIFQKQNLIVRELTNKINETETIQKKTKLAEELGKEVDVLILCSNYDDKSLDCTNCRFISNVRKKTANLIIKARKLT